MRELVELLECESLTYGLRCRAAHYVRLQLQPPRHLRTTPLAASAMTVGAQTIARQDVPLRVEAVLEYWCGTVGSFDGMQKREWVMT